MTRRYLDFEVIKESWDVYTLHDGTKLKIRVMLKTAWVNTDDPTTVRVDVEQQNVCLCDPAIQGSPGAEQYTPEQLGKHVEVSHCKYDTTRYDACEYLLDDGSRLVVHCTVSNIARTSLFDNRGDRIYVITATGNATHTPQLDTA